MKKTILILLTFFTLHASAQETSKAYDKIGRFHNGVAFVWKDGLVGVIRQNGKEVIRPEYQKIGNFGSDGIAVTTKDGMIGLINRDGKVLAPNVYESIAPFRGSRALTKKGGLYGIINKQGKVLIDNKYEKLVVGRYGDVRAIKDGQEILLDIKD
jgi:WG containing repeat